MHIKSISTNLGFERILHFDLESPYVIVVGDNGTGKTAVMNAVRLACTGAAQDLGGKDPRKEVRVGVRDLVSREKVAAEAIVRFSNESEQHWTHAFAKRPTIQSTGHTPEVILPFDDALDAFRGNSDTRLKYFCQYFMATGKFDGETWMQWADWTLAPSVHTVIREANPSNHPVMWLLDFWKRQASVERAATKRLSFINDVELFVDEHLDSTSDSRVAHALDTLLTYQLSHDRTGCPCCGADSTADILRERLDKVTAIIKTKVLAPPAPSRMLIERERDAATHDRASARRYVGEVRSLLQDALRHNITAIEGAVNSKIQACAPARQRERVDILFGFDAKTNGDIIMGRRMCEYIRPFPSAAETVLLLTALSLAASEFQEKLPIMLIPDRAYDKDMFHHLCVLLGQSKTIAFVPSVAYALPPSDKWGRIDLNEHTGRGIPK